MAGLILKRDPNSGGDEFYLVHHDGKSVGRILNRLIACRAKMRRAMPVGSGAFPLTIRRACCRHFMETQRRGMPRWQRSALRGSGLRRPAVDARAITPYW